MGLTLTNDPIEPLAEKWSLRIDEVREARERARSKRQEFKEICAKEKLLTQDTSVVVFGSLARDEYTVGSDADWTLLIDGEANSDHSRVARRISALIGSIFEAPNPTGAFGGMTFSHQLIHNIGGPDDTNANTTQRVLMLLESRSIHGLGDAAYGRVVRGILNRYVEQEISHLNQEHTTYKVPRFLLNDIVRFWRTMAVDFASKQWARGGQGWGIRNAKLRLSRKLIYISGLLTCFSCPLDGDLNSKIDSERDRALQLVNHLRQCVKNSPLEVLASFLLAYDTTGDASKLIFTAYNEFLGILNDVGKRQHLQDLRAEDSARDSLFLEIRRVSDAFQEGLDKFFFENHNILPLTKKYGVF
ncbi:MAG TPA: nucleotidyltransferase domain-containing protein [Candidatus Angelobacter sp.]|jgi:predicted nucleotidyltransferase|nr:nucleotidyltransferase domain-containing protein [Candidatus Angelobacter sp.]